ncbi:MAG: CHAT domain-containing protein, partial [Leptolyngbya sp. SIO1D8]|nr:CHAT domain-containing protein [Leptolyngbya sp. SIO1D8]
EAIAFSEQALELSRQFDDRAGEGDAIGSLGIAHGRLGRYQQALEFLKQQLTITRELNNLSGEGTALGNLGIIYFELGRYDQAIELHEQHLAIAQELQDQDAESTALINLGIVYASLGQHEQVIELYKDQLIVARELNNRVLEVATLGNLGTAHKALGQYEQAIEFHKQQLEIARDIGDRAGEGYGLGALGLVYRELGDYDRAIETYQQRLILAREIGDLPGASRTLNNLGFVYLQTDQFALAETTLTTAIEIQDSLLTSELTDADKISLFETQQNAFSLLQRALIPQDKSDSALEIAERGRARAFAELLARQLDTEDDNIGLEQLNSSDIRALAAQQKATLIEYSLLRGQEFEPIIYIWVISPDGTVAFRKQPLTDIDLTRLIIDTRQRIGVRGKGRGAAPVPTPLDPEAEAQQVAQLRAEADTKLTQLHRLLIDPIADLLPTDPNQNVVFIPQGELFLVPFPALKDNNGNYLIENHTILTAPSIQVLQLTQDIAETNTTLSSKPYNPLIVGDPTMPEITSLSETGTFDTVRLHPLYGARQEAEAIGEFLEAAVLIGNDATEATVKQRLANADLIHLATHGLLEYGDPRETGSRDTPGAIALAPGNGEDGLLTSAEILQMDLQADLVVLSACDTGRGRITGDGVIGLSRSFIAAGVPSVIVSLWAVPDAPTAELMTEFYRQLDQGQNKAQALRQAMLIMMQDHPDPKDWAAFTLIGEAN